MTTFACLTKHERKDRNFYLKIYDEILYQRSARPLDIIRKGNVNLSYKTFILSLSCVVIEKEV